MTKRVIRFIFIGIFLCMLAVPMITTNFDENKISEAENRKLAPQPRLVNEDKKVNKAFLQDFEKWINDNIGFRSQMVVQNAYVQYYVFNVLSNNSDMYLGPQGELNYATKEMLADYQHRNLYTEEALDKKSESLQLLKNYSEKKGASFFYCQCWDKHSVYPEQFPVTVIQEGTESKTDRFIQAFREKTDVCIVSPKEDLIAAKDCYDTYSTWGDPTHWTYRGAYIGYLTLMHAINEKLGTDYRILTDEDYQITLQDLGKTVFGGIHKTDVFENIQVKNPTSRNTKEKLTLYADDQRHRFFTNDTVDNNTRLLIIGDSYFNDFIIDDLAESFHEVIILWGDYLHEYKEIMEAYEPDIVVVEAAERVDRTGRIEMGAEALKKLK